MTFEALFGRAPAAAADAPGRVNLIGEHTDYNGGFVLPAAIPQRTRVEVAPRSPIAPCGSGAPSIRTPPIEFTLGAEARARNWADYVKGMTRVLAEAGPLAGFDARVASDVPVGSGLSSSAALEIAVGRALRDLSRLAFDDVALARLGQRAENELVGAPVGIMDQMACSLAETSAALFLDTRSLTYSRVPLPADAGLIVIDSGVAHDHATGDYATRAARVPGRGTAARRARAARHRTGEIDRIEALPEPLNRRARHVVTENARVLAAVEALRTGTCTV